MPSESPKAEAELPPDGCVDLTVEHGELPIIADCVDVKLQEMSYLGPEGRDSEMHSRIDIRSWEAEAFMDEVRRLDREVRI